MATAKQVAHAMVTYFAEQYKAKYGVKPELNRFKARWVFDDMLTDIEEEDVKKIIDYYFATQSLVGHSLDWFQYNYEKLAVAMEATEKDRAALALIREESRRRTEEWNQKHGNN